jgi:hypothetical protein
MNEYPNFISYLKSVVLINSRWNVGKASSQFSPKAFQTEQTFQKSFFEEKIEAKPEDEDNMKCPNNNCKNTIEEKKSKTEESNFVFCKDCGTVVYRRERK